MSYDRVRIEVYDSSVPIQDVLDRIIHLQECGLKVVPRTKNGGHTLEVRGDSNDWIQLERKSQQVSEN